MADVTIFNMFADHRDVHSARPEKTWAELTCGLPEAVRFPNFERISSIKRIPILVKPDHLPDPNKDVAHYIQSWDPKYQQLLGRLAAQMDPLSSQSRLSICIPVAGAQEHTHIFRCIESFADQTLSPNCFDIHLLVNYPFKDLQEHGTALRNMYEQVERAKKCFPYLHIYTAHLQTGCSKNITIGLLRSIVTDLALLRKYNLGDGVDHLLARCDADTRAVKRTWAATYLQHHNRYPNVDSFMGSIFWSPEQTYNAPIPFLDHTLFALLASRDRIGGDYSWWAGPNCTIRMSSYAYLGGYNPNCRLAEDQDLVKRTIAWRESSSQFIGVKRAGAAARLFSSTRRSLSACALGEPVGNQWSDARTSFNLSDHSIRGRENHTISSDQKSSAALRAEITDLALSHVVRYVRLGTEEFKELRPLLKEALGISFMAGKNGEIRIASVDGFINLSRRISREGPDKWRKLYQRDTAGFDALSTFHAELNAPAVPVQEQSPINSDRPEQRLPWISKVHIRTIVAPAVAVGGLLFGSFYAVSGMITGNLEEMFFGSLSLALTPLVAGALLRRAGLGADVSIPDVSEDSTNTSK